MQIVCNKFYILLTYRSQCYLPFFYKMAFGIQLDVLKAMNFPRINAFLKLCTDLFPAVPVIHDQPYTYGMWWAVTSCQICGWRHHWIDAFLMVTRTQHAPSAHGILYIGVAMHDLDLLRIDLHHRREARMSYCVVHTVRVWSKSMRALLGIKNSGRTNVRTWTKEYVRIGPQRGKQQLFVGDKL